ncbi:MAG: cysteine desulfurase [Bacilli bacterium]|jgi:cysteine desulfurase|nr:cysteine desulfurase [Bacilli bacterium]
MIYLDYSATTPVSYDVLESYLKATKDFIGNPNSLHSLGVKSKTLMNTAIKQISELFNVLESEITFTSGATESNNMALIGACLANQHKGHHIIVSKLEHPSIYKICEYLEQNGFYISYVNNDEEGLIDFDDLKNKMREDTILVSICAVNSEVGIRQPLKMIRQIIKKENSNTLFHSDMTQAVGKIPVNFHDVDMASITAHKIFGPKGIGLFYKNSRVKIVPLIYGSGKSNELKPGTPAVPLIVSFSKALRLALTDLDKRENFVRRLNEKIVGEFQKLDGIILNQTKYSIPQILNISLKNIRPETLIHALEEYEIYVSTNTACASGELSTSIMAIYNDKKRAMSSIRISLSYITTTDEINRFLSYFKTIYHKLNELTD